MRFEIRETSGGLTVFDADAGECYKSRHSAWAEARSVFFEPGVRQNRWWGAEPFRILELGFGLGTNLQYLASQSGAIELITVDRDLSGAQYLLSREPNETLAAILEKGFIRAGSFSARLLNEDFFIALPRLISAGEKFHCVYFDPFSPKANPEAWQAELFHLASALLHTGGRLVTYSVSRAAKDSAAAAGLITTKLGLPPELRKRSSLLAIKPE